MTQTTWNIGPKTNATDTLPACWTIINDTNEVVALASTEAYAHAIVATRRAVAP